ncbi:MFS transporter [Prosthecomicrobium sp. N25]|uniref:MFS transporter n=1 Tax=Prosthecomicrobium sp. N25 TaxID=3129254 RepID=UPI003078818E
MSDRPRIPRTVWALGFTSLFMDVSSEMIHGLLPVFLVGVLGASATMLGILEGVAEATAQIVKVFSGWISDRFARRKALALAGYGLAALTKPLFPLADSVGAVFLARFADRIGKGIRGAPRDALVADVTPPEIRGAAYGIRQSLDTVGAAVGPVLAIGLMLLLDDIRTVLWFAVLPALVAVAILFLGVEEPARDRAAATRPPPIRAADIARLGRPYGLVVLLGAVFALARFSEAFLVVRAQQAGLPLAFAPGVIALMSLAYAASSYPAGLAQDRFGPAGMLAGGFALLAVADVVLAVADGLPGLAIGIVVWGLHMGLTQGVLATLVAGAAPAAVRGTAFGLFNLATGLATLGASVLAGLLWDRWGPAATFLAGAGLAAAALAILPAVLRAGGAPAIR